MPCCGHDRSTLYSTLISLVSCATRADWPEPSWKSDQQPKHQTSIKTQRDSKVGKQGTRMGLSWMSTSKWCQMILPRENMQSWYTINPVSEIGPPLQTLSRPKLSPFKQHFTGTRHPRLLHENLPHSIASTRFSPWACNPKGSCYGNPGLSNGVWFALDMFQRATGPAGENCLGLKNVMETSSKAPRTWISHRHHRSMNSVLLWSAICTFPNCCCCWPFERAAKSSLWTRLHWHLGSFWKIPESSGSGWSWAVRPQAMCTKSLRV